MSEEQKTPEQTPAQEVPATAPEAPAQGQVANPEQPAEAPQGEQAPQA